MFPDGKLGRRVIGSFLLGSLVASINLALDSSIIRWGISPHTYALNSLIIGAAAGLFAHIWMARQATRNKLELSRQKLSEEIVQKERKRIALELHDTVCQAQTGAIMHLECVGDCLCGNPEAQEHLNRAAQLVRGSMAEMRRALSDLYPEELEKLDLKGALESLVSDMSAVSGLKAHLSVDGMIRPLPPEIEKGLLRISREALSNVVKHAQAREVQIALSFDSQRARLRVKDDGQGFQHELVPGTFGLTSMEDRTKALGGVCTVRSEPGRGTEVLASIPIPFGAELTAKR